MMRFLKVIGSIVLLVVIAYGAYILYLSFYPYLANGAVPAKKVAEKAAANNDLEACSKIKTYPFPLFISGFDVTKDDIKMFCYYKLAELKEDKTICERVRPYQTNPTVFIKGCEDGVGL